VPINNNTFVIILQHFFLLFHKNGAIDYFWSNQLCIKNSVYSWESNTFF